MINLVTYSVVHDYIEYPVVYFQYHHFTVPKAEALRKKFKKLFDSMSGADGSILT